MMLLLQLLLFVLLSGVLHVTHRLIVRRWPSVQGNPSWFVLLALLSLLVFVPWPTLTAPLGIPAHLLADTQWQLAQWQVKPEHPQLLQQQTWPDAWSQMVALLVGISCWRLLQVALRYRRLAQLVASATPLTPPVADWPRHVALKQFSQPQSAFACGLWRPTVMVPAYVNELSQDQQMVVLRHELTHVQRGDAWGLCGWQLLTALAWFNPFLVRWQQAWQQAVELQVDRVVCQQLQAQQSPTALHPALLYAQTLLWCLKRHQLAAPAATMAWSTGMAQYQQRLTELFQPAPAAARSTRVLCISVLGLVSVLVAVGCSQLRQPSGAIAWSSPVALQTPVSSPFGEVSALRQQKPHMGIDLAGVAGAPVYATARATVVIADADSLNPNYGNAVLLDHGQGYQSLYAHLERSAVQAGDTVMAGQIIGWIGQTGKATGPHLHFEWLHHGAQQDPTLLLATPPQS